MYLTLWFFLALSCSSLSCFLSGLYVSVGLENIHRLATSKKYQLRVDMEDWEGKKVYALYQSFNVDTEKLGYTLHVDGFINGGAGVCVCVCVCV